MESRGQPRAATGIALPDWAAVCLTGERASRDRLQLALTPAQAQQSRSLPSRTVQALSRWHRRTVERFPWPRQGQQLEAPCCHSRPLLPSSTSQLAAQDPVPF